MDAFSFLLGVILGSSLSVFWAYKEIQRYKEKLEEQEKEIIAYREADVPADG